MCREFFLKQFIHRVNNDSPFSWLSCELSSPSPFRYLQLLLGFLTLLCPLFDYRPYYEIQPIALSNGPYYLRSSLLLFLMVHITSSRDYFTGNLSLRYLFIVD